MRTCEARLLPKAKVLTLTKPKRRIFMKTKFYIAYGSNMSELQMRHRCPDAVLVGTSEVKNYELLFKGSKTGSYATIEKKRGSVVPVLIWKISKADESNLDIYEGFPTFYYKKNIKVEIDGETVTAMAYIMDESRQLGIPSDRYYGILDDAYWKFGFDYEVLENAFVKSLEGAKR
jgi:gamma-glutamylcyclotransferase (GGCT)/AIG2-like uncharacterized protein YtfP